MREHIGKYMIHYDDLDKNMIHFKTEYIYCADTESCFISQELFNIYTKGERPNTTDDVVKVYAWGLSNTGNDYVLYGETLSQFFDALNRICYNGIDFSKLSDSKAKRIKSEMKLKIFIHNLAWDIEFFKYYLLRSGHTYYNSVVKDNKKINQKNKAMSFNIVENNNIVYSMQLNLKPTNISYRKKIKKEFHNIKDSVFPQIEFLDFFKILSFKLDDIGKNVIKIDDKFHKLSDQYDYDKIRPDGHKLDEIERMYLYNDVYILKESVLQFYIPLDCEKTTASGISFHKYITGKYGDDKPYKSFIEDYPDLSNKIKIFNNIKESYRGGWTQANYKYKGKHLKDINGTSIDINSSYPAIISGHLKLNDKYEGTPLPFGTPELYEGYHKCNSNELNILTIEFDKFYNKESDNLIGEIQVGAINSEIFGRIGTDYINTNIKNGKPKGTNAKSLDKRYRLYIWEFELESILKNTVFEDYDVIETLTFKSNIGHFEEQVSYYNDMKIQGKKEGNKVMQTFAKLINNSLYGKFASNYERNERKVVLENGLVKNETTDIQYDSDKRYYPAFASCVTAWARVNLRDTLYKIGYNNVLYFDTDSLYTLLPLDEVKKVMGDKLDKYILGKWDIEKSYKEFKTIGSKKYMVKENDVIKYTVEENGKMVEKNNDNNIVCKCAGLPQEVRENILFDDFNLGNPFEGKKMKTKVPGGYVLLESTYILHEFSLSR